MGAPGDFDQRHRDRLFDKPYRRDAGDQPNGQVAVEESADTVDQAAARPYASVASDLGVNRHSVTAREQDRYGGVRIGSALFGFMTANGIAALLTALLAAPA